MAGGPAAMEQTEAGSRQRLARGGGDPGSNQHIAPAFGRQTIPRRQARLRIEAMSWASQTASRFTMLPPPT